MPGIPPTLPATPDAAVPPTPLAPQPAVPGVRAADVDTPVPVKMARLPHEREAVFPPPPLAHASMTNPRRNWYQAETGYDLSHFSIDWETKSVTCPQGRINSSWTPIQREGKSLIQVRFSQTDCKACPSRTSCTGTTRRTLTLHSKEQTQALLAARKREAIDAFKEAYRHRAGIEGTHVQALHTMGLRCSRYIGLRKTHLGHIAIAAAINLVRLTSFLQGETSESIRISAFKRAMKQAA